MTDLAPTPLSAEYLECLRDSTAVCILGYVSQYVNLSTSRR